MHSNILECISIHILYMEDNTICMYKVTHRGHCFKDHLQSFSQIKERIRELALF